MPCDSKPGDVADVCANPEFGIDTKSPTGAELFDVRIESNFHRINAIVADVSGENILAHRMDVSSQHFVLSDCRRFASDTG
ncbi:hypothetical protein GCM10007901_44910 [Dyella acidisoli]|uniref:Uncharacterized protein n=1 Tax=Dyella acidisoli TaxID=1867834 RepID=A0ABQ5XYN4_9GAMM|nr:hypothetical protein GCM10007901_44910 [Dyella acidisoli]